MFGLYSLKYSFGDFNIQMISSWRMTQFLFLRTEPTLSLQLYPSRNIFQLRTRYLFTYVRNLTMISNSKRLWFCLISVLRTPLVLIHPPTLVPNNMYKDPTKNIFNIMNGSHSVLYFMSSKKPETADSGLVLQQWLSLSMLILSTMLTEIRVYIFKTFQPKFQLIK